MNTKTQVRKAKYPTGRYVGQWEWVAKDRRGTIFAGQPGFLSREDAQADLTRWVATSPKPATEFDRPRV